MSININIPGVTEKPEYPLIRRWVGHSTGEEKKGLVVIFVSLTEGFAISGVSFSELGRMQTWVPHTDDSWEKCSITLTSEN